MKLFLGILIVANVIMLIMAFRIGRRWKRHIKKTWPDHYAKVGFWGDYPNVWTSNFWQAAFQMGVGQGYRYGFDGSGYNNLLVYLNLIFGIIFGGAGIEL